MIAYQKAQKTRLGLQVCPHRRLFPDLHLANLMSSIRTKSFSFLTLGGRCRCQKTHLYAPELFCQVLTESSGVRRHFLSKLFHNSLQRGHKIFVLDLHKSNISKSNLSSYLLGLLGVKICLASAQCVICHVADASLFCLSDSVLQKHCRAQWELRPSSPQT